MQDLISKTAFAEKGERTAEIEEIITELSTHEVRVEILPEVIRGEKTYYFLVSFGSLKAKISEVSHLKRALLEIKTTPKKSIGVLHLIRLSDVVYNTISKTFLKHRSIGDAQANAVLEFAKLADLSVVLNLSAHYK